MRKGQDCPNDDYQRVTKLNSFCVVPARAALRLPGVLGTEVSVAGYMNYIRGWTQLVPTRDIIHTYDAEMALAETPAALVARMDLLLFHGTLPPTLRTQIEAAVASVVIPGPAYPPGTAASAIPTTTPTNKAAMDAAKLNRVYLAVFMSMASPDYLIQK